MNKLSELKQFVSQVSEAVQSRDNHKINQIIQKYENIEFKLDKTGENNQKSPQQMHKLNQELVFANNSDVPSEFENYLRAKNLLIYPEEQIKNDNKIEKFLQNLKSKILNGNINLDKLIEHIDNLEITSNFKIDNKIQAKQEMLKAEQKLKEMQLDQFSIRITELSQDISLKNQEIKILNKKCNKYVNLITDSICHSYLNISNIFNPSTQISNILQYQQKFVTIDQSQINIFNEFDDQLPQYVVEFKDISSIIDTQVPLQQKLKNSFLLKLNEQQSMVLQASDFNQFLKWECIFQGLNILKVFQQKGYKIPFQYQQTIASQPIETIIEKQQQKPDVAKPQIQNQITNQIQNQNSLQEKDIPKKNEIILSEQMQSSKDNTDQEIQSSNQSTDQKSQISPLRSKLLSTKKRGLSLKDEDSINQNYQKLKGIDDSVPTKLPLQQIQDEKDQKISNQQESSADFPLLEKGIIFSLIAKDNELYEYIFGLNSQKTQLQWCESLNKQIYSLDLNDINNIVVGGISNKFEKFKGSIKYQNPELCFTIFSNSIQLDLIAKKVQHREQLCIYLFSVIEKKEFDNYSKQAGAKNNKNQLQINENPN